MTAGDPYFYCVEHGIRFGEWDAGATLTVAEAQKYGSIDDPNLEIAWRAPGCGRHKDFEHNGEWTHPYLRCVGEHTSLLTVGYIDTAYCISYPTNGVWTLPKQEAVWCTPYGGGNGSPNSIYNEAVKFKEFFAKTTSAPGSIVKPDIDVKDETDYTKVTVRADYNAQTLTVGPYSIDYIYGYYKEIATAFGGISDMYFIGYNSKGVKVKDRIEIKRYIDGDGNGYDLKYFEPNEGDESFVDRKEQVYPKGKSQDEDEFYVTMENPNAGISGDSEDQYVAKVKLHIDFKWMGITKGMVCRKQGFIYTVSWRCVDNWNHSHGYPNSYPCFWCTGYSKLVPTDIQDHLEVMEAQRTLFTTFIELGDEPLDITMDLGGKVWEDVPEGKESLTDGIYKEGIDRVLPNIEVTLYTEDGKKAILLANAQEAKNDADLMSRVNSTYTDEKGDYLFKGLDPLKKYYVTFEYNGQVYLPTDYKMDISQYNKVDWFWTSKGTEKGSERDSYDQTYFEIGSAPANYLVPSDSMKIAPLTNGYNESFSQYDLMGFKMTENGDYVQETRLIDSFYKIEGGNIVETNENQEGEISKAIKEFIKANKKSPTENDMIGIYQKIASGNEEMLRKMQFIEDTKIDSYTKAMDAGNYDLYPVYDQFIINKTIDMEYDTAEEARNQSYDLTEETLDGVVYKPIYPGQFYINQGLWRRQEVDLALRKDVLYAATRINGKTEVYSYNKRDDYTEEQKAELRRLRQIYEQNGRKPADYQAYLDKKAEFELTNEKGYWQIQLRMRDYNNYYGANYTKELYEADYNYRSAATNQAGANKELQLYVTYKITVRNASQSIVGEITELVDYYDRDYTYRDDLSWVMYKNSSKSNDLNEVNFTEADYYDTIDGLSLQGNIRSQNKGTNSSEAGRYENERSRDCRSDMVGYEGYQAVYIKGLESKQLASGEEAYVYLTFEVNKTSGKIITDTDDSLKENYVEINGYKTYYEDGTNLPNGVTKGRNDAAGLIDINSTPGNLCTQDLQGNKYEKNFENDTDRAKSIKVVVREDFIRSVNGTVWEDERLYNVSNTNAMIGDGIRQDKEVGVNGVTVELVERLENGDQYVWQETVSGSGKGRRRNVETGEWEDYNYEFIDNGRGKYEFAKAITGNYFVRFRYGDTTKTANTDQNGGQNKTSYNGQDFKSTVYQKDMKTNKEIDGYNGYTGMTINQYNGEYSGTSVGYYDIRQSDSLRVSGSNFSDAKDLWNNANVKYVGGDEKTIIGRQQVMNYSNNNGNGVTNGLAEILASPYTTGNTDELIKNTQMTAVTGLIVLEGEYNRTDSDGYTNVNNGAEFYDNANNGNYVLNDVDFGLTERPKAQLELGKKITNVKITLANGNILFDANDKMTDLLWTKGEAYELNKVGIKNKKYQEFYGLDNHRYTYRTDKGSAAYSVNGLVASKYRNNGNNGLIVATMDEELMQGANITISYLLTVTNVGETDYYNAEQEKAFAQKGTGESFYYKGTGASTIVKTKADVVTDYVANNLNFKTNNNEGTGWKVTDNALTTLGLNNNLATKVSQYNNVIHTNNLNKELAPTENTTVGLVLTQLINPENSTDDKTYDNIAEITTISNPIGRRMAYSIQGNQDPTADASEEGKLEVDSAKSERVTILPPFGIGDTVVYIAIAVSVLAILAGGIILIKKKVLNK